jgi:GR25 family glycosyltransferase involved in LPS biosynthesis
MNKTLKYLEKINNQISKNNNYLKFDLFNNAYLINLDSRIDRLSHSIKELNKVNIKYTRFPGLIFKDKGKYESIGARGCAESHLTIIENNHNSKSPFLIIEDDIIIANYFNKIADFIKIIPKEYDLLFFYNTFRKNNNIKWLKAAPFGTHFYIINNKSVDKILNLSKNNNLVIDKFYMNSQFISYSTSISFVKQSTNFNTDIQYKNIKSKYRYNPSFIE